MPTVGEPFESQDPASQQPAASAPRDPLHLLEALPVPIFVVEDHRITFINDAQARLLGAGTPGEVIGNRIDKFIVADARERFLRALDDLALEVGKSGSLTERFLRTDGRSLNAEYIAKSISHDGRIAIEAVLRKVLIAETPATAREPEKKRSWFSRREKRQPDRPPAVEPQAPLPPESAFIQALEALPEGVYWLDDKGVCRFINRTGAELLGYEPEEVIGKSFHELAHYRRPDGELVSADDCAIHTTRGTIEPKQIARDVMWKWDGASIPVSASTAPLPSGGRVVSFRAVEEVRQKPVRNVEREIEAARVEERRATAEAVASAVRKERTSGEERLRQAVEDERKKTSRALNETVEDDRRKTSRALTEALEEERKRASRALADAVAEERRAYEVRIKESEKRLREAVEHEKKKIARAVEEAVAAEREKLSETNRSAEKRMREIAEQERIRNAAAFREAVEAEQRTFDARLEQALAQERAAKDEAIAAAIATERASNKRAVRDAVATERSVAEAAVRDAARVAAERAVREAQDISRKNYEEELRAAMDAERAETEREFNQRLAEQRTAIESILARERGEAQKALAEARSQAEKAMIEARAELEKSSTEVRAEADRRVAEERTRLTEERERANKALNEALAAERRRAEDEIDAAVAEAREAAIRTMEQARIEASRELEEAMRVAAARDREAAIAAERRAAQAAISAAVEAERGKFGAALKQMAEDNRNAAAEAVQKAVDSERASSAKAVREALASARTTWERERPQTQIDPRLALLLDSVAEGIYALDLEGRFTHINHAAAQMLGLDPQKVIGQPAHDLIHSKRRDGSPYPLAECPIHSGVRLGHMSTGDDEHLWSRKGASFPIDYSYAPIHQGPKVAGGVVTFKDITERKLMGQEAAQIDRMSSLGRFASAATHEFEKILQGIRSAAEVIRWHSSGDELEDAKAQLVRTLERGSHLTRQISRFTEPRDAETKPIELVDWFQTFLQAARVALKENIELNFRLPDETLYVKADPGQLNQIFMNLLLNARDAMPTGGRLTLSIDSCLSGSTYSFGVLPTPDRFIHFVVEDTGVGIPPELMSRIFEPLFTTKGSGTAGMGLAICHQLVRKLGGSIFVESNVGTGTQFHIFLPASYPEVDENKPAPAENEQPIETAPAPAPARKRVVVISSEDFSADQKQTAAVAGVDIEVVFGGIEAGERIQLSTPDALLMEITWMEVDGVDVYRDIATRWPKLPIIVSTAKIHEVKIRGGVLNMPNVRYLPYDLPTLLKWVEGPRK